MLTVEQAKALKVGQQVFTYVLHLNGRTSVCKWKVNGQPRRWAKDLGRVEVPLKYGLYRYGRMTQNNLMAYYATYEEAQAAGKARSLEVMAARQAIPDDGYADGGEPYTDEEMEHINHVG